MLAISSSTNVLNSEYLSLCFKVKNVKGLTEKLFENARKEFSSQVNFKVGDLLQKDNVIKMRNEWKKIYESRDYTLTINDFLDPVLNKAWVRNQIEKYFQDDLETDNLLLTDTEKKKMFIFKALIFISTQNSIIREERISLRYSAVKHFNNYFSCRCATYGSLSYDIRDNIHTKKMNYNMEHTKHDFAHFYSRNERIELYREILRGMNVRVNSNNRNDDLNDLNAVRTFLKKFEIDIFRSSIERASDMIDEII